MLDRPICWGKHSADGRIHPLVDHCIDVALVVRMLLDVNARHLERLTPAQKDRLSVFAFLHDIGKCNWGFQAKVIPGASRTAGHVVEALALFRDERVRSAWPNAWGELIEELCSWLEEGEEGAIGLLLAAISHHGRPLRWDEEGWHRGADFWRVNGDRDPMFWLNELVESARRTFPRAFEPGVSPITATPNLQHRFAGLVMLGDWIGSDTQFFPYRIDRNQDRVAFARLAAQKALSAIGILLPNTRTIDAVETGDGFRSIFGFSPEVQPSPLQRWLANELPVDEKSQLVLVESDTGSGKTEAALAWFLRLYAAGEVDGLYFALPTRVAAREIYGRVLRAIDAAFAADSRPAPVLLAVPGYVQADGVPAFVNPEGVLWDDDGTARLRERLWSAERPKRFLAAPIAIGTIDQALLSALKVKHNLLRSVCLDRHLLVVDEVHASDTYMGEVLRVLLDGHLARGGRALLLSATLGDAATSTFFKRPIENFDDATKRPYPSVTTLSKEVALVTGRPSREIEIELSPTINDDSSLLSSIKDALTQGARVLVICNTVSRSNALLRRFEEHLEHTCPELLSRIFEVHGTRCPHHGRFAREDRERLDAAVTARMGRNCPAGGLLLVGTQTLEQSLDIDADWLITDLAPMDVLLQRMGRLHRHVRERRPEGFFKPRAMVRVPARPLHEYLNSRGEFRGPAGLGPVYADGRVLCATLNNLHANPLVRIPEENRWRIESTTHPEALSALPSEWSQHADYMKGDFLADLRQADRFVMPSNIGFGELHFNVDGDRVLTRLGDPTYEIPLLPAAKSPFDVWVARLAIPARYLRGKQPPEALVASAFEGGFSVNVAGSVYSYTRFGLEKSDV